MNFRTSHLVGIFAFVLTVCTVGPSINSAVAASLKITGPDGQASMVKRQYGPTTSSDTFWSIAQAVKPDNSVTVYQVMSALFDANPHAFSGTNYNSLERGMILLVPSKDVMLQLSTKDAKKRAENNDRGWSLATKTKSAKSIPKQLVKPAVKLKVKPATKTNETLNAIQSLTEKLEQEKALNLALTDELARATDEITIGSTDTKSFEEKISELQAENALLKQALQDKSLANKDLKNDVAAKQEKIDLLSQEKEPTSTLWRSLMDSPLLLILGAVVPALLILGLFWMFIRRGNRSGSSAEVSPETSEAATLVEKTTLDKESDTDDSLAIHLDPEQAEDPIDSMNDIERPNSNNSTEVVVEEAVDEGQSLDDLWAEAMGEQDAEESKEEDLDVLLTGFDEEPKIDSAAEEDDLDALLSSFDEEPKIDSAAEEEDLDALLSSFDEEPKIDSAAEEEDLDALLSSFDEEPKIDSAAEEEDLDALLSSFDEEPKIDSALEEDDLDALLSSFDEEPKIDSAAEEEDLDTLLSSFDEEPINEEATDKMVSGESTLDDLDSLLAEFDISANEQKALSADGEIDALSDDIAAELELPLEIAAELDFSADDISINELDLDNELDSLLADLEAPVDESAVQIPQESIALIDDIAAELATEVPVEEGELDSLLAEFNLSATSADDVLNKLESGEEDKGTSAVAADTDFTLDFDTSELDNATFSKLKNDVDTDEEVSIDINADAEESAQAAGDMIEFSSTPIELSTKVEKDSGFFDDLKGLKKPEPQALDWDVAATELTDPTLTDDELLSTLAATGSPDVEDEINAFVIEDDSKLTVDQALAALDANEVSASAQSIPEHDLTTFQKDNGFIDIDRLLNEADEDNVETDLYQELDVDMGELDALMANTSMVDVDDAENSINAKLDLARAYIEIDDNDSARALLKEVELDGNERQQAEAAGLINELV